MGKQGFFEAFFAGGVDPLADDARLIDIDDLGGSADCRSARGKLAGDSKLIFQPHDHIMNIVGIGAAAAA